MILRFITLLGLALAASVSAYAAGTSADVVYELPAGATATTYVREATSFRQWGADNIKEETVAGAISYIAIADGKMYVSNMMQYGTTGYVVGDVNGDKVTFTFPQTIEKNGEFLQISCLDTEVIETPGETPLDPTTKRYTFHPSASQTIEYTLTDGKYTAASDIRLGLMEDDKWYGYGEFNQTFTPFESTLVTPPADAEPMVLSLCYTGNISWPGKDVLYTFASGLKKGNKVYLAGLSSKYPQAWAEGTIEGNRITFAGGQLLGFENGIEYFCGGIDEPEWNEAYRTWEHHYSVKPQIVLAYDESTGTMSALDKNDIITINTSANIYSYGTIFANPVFKTQPAEVDPTPTSVLFTPGVNVWENGMEPHLSFQVLPLNRKGQLLVQNDMGFEIEVEGKLYVFDADIYWIDENMTFVPWNFQGPNFDMMNNGFTNIWFQEEHFMRDVRVYAVYKHDGQTYRSAALNPDDPSSVDSLYADESPVVAEAYYSISGSRLDSAPSTGLYIVARTHADGTVTTAKIIK